MDSAPPTEKKSSNSLKTILIIALFAIALFIVYSIVGSWKSEQSTAVAMPKDTTKVETDSNSIDEDFIKAVLPVVDSNERYTLVSSAKDMSIALDGNAGAREIDD